MPRHLSDAILITSAIGAIIFVVALIVWMVRSAVSDTGSGEGWHWDANDNNYMSVDCPMCGARRDNYCRGKNGIESSRPHAARLRKFQQLLRQREVDSCSVSISPANDGGYDEGRKRGDIPEFPPSSPVLISPDAR
jgi:hypothetical protein